MLLVFHDSLAVIFYMKYRDNIEVINNSNIIELTLFTVILHWITDIILILIPIIENFVKIIYLISIFNLSIFIWGLIELKQTENNIIYKEDIWIFNLISTIISGFVFFINIFVFILIPIKIYLNFLYLFNNKYNNKNNNK